MWDIPPMFRIRSYKVSVNDYLLILPFTPYTYHSRQQHIFAVKMIIM